MAAAALLDQPLAEFGATLLDKRWNRLRKRGEAIEAHGAEALHEVRLDAKRLRYAAVLSPRSGRARPPAASSAAFRPCRRNLGLANDTTVARGLVGSLAGVPAWAVGALEGFAAGRTGRARKQALEAWEELLDADPFWR